MTFFGLGVATTSGNALAIRLRGRAMGANDLPGIVVSLSTVALENLRMALLTDTLEGARPLIESARSVLLQLSQVAAEAAAEKDGKELETFGIGVCF
jgi:hypothetical protein